MGSTKGAESGVRERGRGRGRAESEGTEGSARVVEGAGDGERNGNGERKGGRSRDGERMETRGENGDGENGEAMVRVAGNDGEKSWLFMTLCPSMKSARRQKTGRATMTAWR